MKEINDITVKVTYLVSLSNLVVQDIVHQQLSNNTIFNMNDDENDETFDWLLSKIHEDDAHEWEVEVIKLDME